MDEPRDESHDQPRDDELAERVAELESTLRELRAELRPRERQRGPFGLPAPPSPGEVLAFTNEFAIPTAIAVLEANVRLLEMLQRVLRVGERAPLPDRSQSGESASVGRVTRDTVAALDESLSDLQTAIEDGSLPRNDAAREILQDARRLNTEIVDELRASTQANGESTEPSTDALEPAELVDAGVDVDVGSELQSIKDEVDAAENDEPEEADGA